MMDSVARRRAASLVRRFRRQELTNDELQDAWPGSRDRALHGIAEEIWTLYDDLYEHLYVPSPDADDLLDRCADFLDTDEEYRWPVANPLLQSLAMPLSLVTLGLVNRLLWKKYRFPPHWPFASPEARAAAQHDQPWGR